MFIYSSLVRVHSTFMQSLPFVLGIFLLNLSPFINTLLTTQQRPEDLAFVGSVVLVFFFAETFTNALSYAVQVYTARLDCGQDQFRLFTNALVVVFGFNLLLFALVACYGHHLLDIVTDHFQLKAVHFHYVYIQTVTFFCNSLLLTLRGFFAGRKRSDLFFTIIAVVVGCQLLFNILFSYYWPALSGLLRIGYAECAAKFIGLGYYGLHFYVSYRQEAAPSERVELHYIDTLLKFIAPLYIFGIFDHYATVILYQVAASSLGDLGFSCLVFVFSVLGCFPGMGFGLAALTPVSNYYAKKHYTQAYNTALMFTWVGSFTVFFCSGLFLFYTPYVLSWFVGDSALLAQSIVPMRIMFATAGIHVACQVSIRCMQAVDQTRLCTSINLVVVYVCRLLLLAAFYSNNLLDVHHFFLVLLLEKTTKLLWMQSYLYYHLRRLRHVDLITARSAI